MVMKYLEFLYYFILNLLNYGKVPEWISYNGEKWFSIVHHDLDGLWYGGYARYLESTLDSDIVYFIEVKSESRYVMYLCIISYLWHNRKNISFHGK